MRQPPLSGRYELEEIIGTGGMSMVYRAWDLKYDREVAVKVLRSELVTDEDFIRRFNHEAQAASQLSHPNIVGMLDVGQDGETRYLVMEYVRGVTLKEMIRQSGAIRPQRAVQITLRILSAIEHAHENHIVHRDIKPQNIIMDPDAGVKVGDFGIARVTTAGSAAAGGQLLGTAHYFSPEQAEGGEADEKSDLYSVGVVLYEMVTGQVPFDGKDADEIAEKHISEPPVPPMELNPEVSKGLNEVIMKALSKRPAERYQSAYEMSVDLRRALKMPTGGFIRRRPGQTGRISRNTGQMLIRAAAMLLGVITVAVVTLGGLRYYQRLQTRIRMPQLTTMREEATATLDSLGLAYQIVEQYSDDVVSDMVISQSPEAGLLVYPETVVRLTVSLGKDSVEVPLLVGMTATDAAYAIGKASLSQGSVILEISDAEPGEVVRQEPAAQERVSPFTEITLYVSGESAPMPALAGLSPEAAEEALVSSGFVRGDLIRTYSEGPAGLVISQSVPPEEETLLGAVVNLYVSESTPVVYRASETLTVHIAAESSKVLCLLDGETELFNDELTKGEQQITLEMESDRWGEHALTVYIDGELLFEKTEKLE